MSVMHTEMNAGDELRMEWDPFNDGQVEGLFFPEAGRAEAAEQLLHLLRYGSSLTLLVGQSGAGKRNLLSHLLAQMDQDLFDVAILDAGETPEFAQLLNQLDDPWRSLRPFTPDNFLELIPAVAAAADDESKTLVFVLKHAQFLSEQALLGVQALLAASAGLPVKCLMLVDAGELESVPGLHGVVEAFPDTAVLYLDPLTSEQTESYLRYRMHTAGLGQVTFNPDQVARIYEASAGVIGKINQIAGEVLLEAMPAASVAKAKPSLPWMHIGALAIVVLALAALFLSRPDKAPVQEEVTSNTVVLEQAVQPEPTKPSPFTEVARVAKEVATPEATEAVPAPSETTTTSVVVEPAPVASVEVVKAAASVPAPKVTENVKEPAPTIAEASKTVPAVEPPAPAPVVVKETKPAPVVAPVVAKPADSRVSWLRSLPKDHYVLQLLGAQEEATVKRFLAQYPSLRKVTFYKTWRQAKPWYVVVQGDYASYDAAKAGIAQLPASLRKQDPWIRKVEIIQQQLGAP